MDPTEERPHSADPGGVQKLYRFPNGFGASVVQFKYSYGGDEGLWELAVVWFPDKDNQDVHSFKLTYKTPITNDVMGHLTEKQVEKTLFQIRALPHKLYEKHLEGI